MITIKYNHNVLVLSNAGIRALKNTKGVWEVVIDSPGCHGVFLISGDEKAALKIVDEIYEAIEAGKTVYDLTGKAMSMEITF